MNTRSLVQWIVTILVVTTVAHGSAVFADSVHIYSGDFNLPIPANPDDTNGWMEDAVIEIPDHITINDLDICISLTHESLFDLQIILRSPGGTNVTLNPAGNLAFTTRDEDDRLITVGGSVELLFDDEADISIEQAAEPFTEPYRPAWSLSSLNDEDAYGLWYLQIYDMWQADTGTLESFELIITTPEPSTALLLILGLALIRLQNPRP